MVPFNEELLALLQTVERAYYFGVFTVTDSSLLDPSKSAVAESTHTEVAAFRHIKDKKNGGVYSWHVYNPRYKRSIEVTGEPKKYRAWCRKIIEADIYQLERDSKKVIIPNQQISSKSKANRKSDQMVTRWLHIMQESNQDQRTACDPMNTAFDTTMENASVIASPRYH